MGEIPGGIQKHQKAKCEQTKKAAIAQKINKSIHRAIARAMVVVGWTVDWLRIHQIHQQLRVNGR